MKVYSLILPLRINHISDKFGIHDFIFCFPMSFGSDYFMKIERERERDLAYKPECDMKPTAISLS